MGTVYGRCCCCGFPSPFSLTAVLLRLKTHDFLRLLGARGVAIEVVGGRVWITEDGRPSDSFLGAGGRYRVSGDGLVLVEAENDETALRLVA